MAMRGEKKRFWFAVIPLFAFSFYSSQKLVRSHFESDAIEPRYEFERAVPASRGAIYCADGVAKTMVQSVPCWEYRLDPVALTNTVVRPKGEKAPRTKEAICRSISDLFGLEYDKVLEMSENSSNRYQFLAQSNSQKVHDIVADRSLICGVAIVDMKERKYFNGRSLCHVLGAVNKEGVGSAGLEQKFNSELSGVSGLVRGYRDARGNELFDKRIETVPPVQGADIYLTIDQNIQYEVEKALAEGVEKYGAGSGWCIVLDAQNANVLAMASLPDFDPLEFGKAPDDAKINRATNFTYEPGSVMKVITASAGIDSGLVTADTLYDTRRDDDRYFRLPGDGRHVWEPKMSVRDAIVHSSNIVIGKLGSDLGPERLWSYMKAFGFGSTTGVEVPGEECGILPHWKKWDRVKHSRAPIGQGVSVTAMQLASAYQAIANDGIRMKPHLVSRIVASDGRNIHTTYPEVASRPISRDTARKIREMMLGVATPNGTARRAAIRGYSVAGKTGTAQKVINGQYSDSLYRATFCGIVPSGAVKRNENDAEPAKPRIVVLVTLDFDERTKYHQGGNSSAPIFQNVAIAALKYLGVEPDRPEELIDFDYE